MRQVVAVALGCPSALQRWVARRISRVARGLAKLGLHFESRGGWYGSYIDALHELIADAPDLAREWRPRDLDLALYMLGG